MRRHPPLEINGELQVNLNLTEQQASWREKAATFAAEMLRPHWESFEAEPRLLRDAAARARSAGVFDACLPEEAAGHNLDLVTTALIVEELASGEGGAGVLMANRYACHAAARLSPNSDFRRKVTRALAQAESCTSPVLLWPEEDEEGAPVERANGLRRQLCGSQVVSVAQGDTNAFVGYSSRGGVDGSKRIGFFVSTEAGVELKPVKNFGLRSLSFHQLSFVKEVKDADAVFEFSSAEEYDGFRSQLSAERNVLMAAVVLGIAGAAFDYALKYSRERMTFGKPINQHQAVALKLADMAIGIESARLMLWEAAHLTQESVDLSRSRDAWAYAREVAIEVAVNAVQTLGGHGYLKFHPVEKWMRDIEFVSLLHAG
jgi:alkylation response protein AidB-like acyl-CoA dehydrogenase